MTGVGAEAIRLDDNLHDDLAPLVHRHILRPSTETATRLAAVLEALPAAVYTTDPAGRITYYNKAAAGLWGHEPVLGNSEWCGSWKLYWPDGTPLPHAQCPMAIALKEKRAVRGMEAIAERPDGTRVSFIPYPTPLHDGDGDIVGAVNMLVDITERKHTEEIEQRLASIVECSDDAIISKDLNGIITSWNKSAERLFGYTAAEAIGKPVKILIPPERRSEEPAILERLRGGERIEHFETIRMRKHGGRLNISLTVSPIRNAAGKIIGASKIARDITERKRAEEQAREYQRQLAVELDDTRRLQAISSRLLHENDVQALYDGFIDAAIELLHSDMASMQMFDPVRGELRLLGARGFDRASLRAFEWVAKDTGTCCAAAMRAGQRVVIPDIETSDVVVGTPAHAAHRGCGIRAVQSTPLIARSGELLGMISNHWREPHQPSERELLLIDVLARQAADLIERRRNEEKITLLAREAEHRAKNVLATAQAIVHLTKAETSKDLKSAIEGRIQALANAHSLFVQSRWAGAALRTLIVQELSPYCQGGEARTSINGPDLILEPSAAQAMAVALHELATNAAKYGALSVPQGRIRVAWTHTPDGGLSLRWSETGGPSVKPPTQKGFGSRVIDALIREQLKGQVCFDWNAEGLACDITIPL